MFADTDVPGTDIDGNGVKAPETAQIAVSDHHDIKGRTNPYTARAAGAGKPG